MEPVKNLKRFVAVLIILILPAALIFANFRNYSPKAVHEHGGSGIEHDAIQGKSSSGCQQPMQMEAPQLAGDAHGDLPLADGRTHEHEGAARKK